MIRKVSFILIIQIFLLISSRSQDAHLSQYFALPMYLNPGLTGLYNGDYKLHGHFREQGIGYIQKPYTTGAFAFERSGRRLSLGLFILNNGSGEFNSFRIYGSGAYRFPFGSNNDHWISAGLQVGYVQKSFNMNELYFQSQYTTNIYHGGFDQSIPSGEQISGESISYPDYNLGIVYYYGNLKSRFNPFIGEAVQHVVEPDESFAGLGSSILSRRYIHHGGVKIKLSNKLQVTPQGYLTAQGNNSELYAELLASIRVNEYNNYVFFGPGYRQDDAIIIHGGIKMKGFTGRVSYDINSSPITQYKTGYSAFEISVGYIRFISKDIKPVIQVCPRL